MNASDSSMGYYVEPLVDRERPRPLLMGFVALGGPRRGGHAGPQLQSHVRNSSILRAGGSGIAEALTRRPEAAPQTIEILPRGFANHGAAPAKDLQRSAGGYLHRTGQMIPSGRRSAHAASWRRPGVNAMITRPALAISGNCLPAASPPDRIRDQGHPDARRHRIDGRHLVPAGAATRAHRPDALPVRTPRPVRHAGAALCRTGLHDRRAKLPRGPLRVARPARPVLPGAGGRARHRRMDRVAALVFRRSRSFWAELSRSCGNGRSRRRWATALPPWP